MAAPLDLQAHAAAGRMPGLISPQALMAIKNLELRARVVVEGFWNGLHRSPYHGFSVEFTEYRQTPPGDGPRFSGRRPHPPRGRYFNQKIRGETHPPRPPPRGGRPSDAYGT